MTKINDDKVTFPDQSPVTDAKLDQIRVTLHDVKLSIDKLLTSKAPGIDNISPYILKQTKHVIAPILHRLFNRSLFDCRFPSVWKLSNVIPIHKKESRSDPSNYRPISLTSTLSKVFEKSVSSYLLSYLLSNNLLYEFQSGFLPKHSPTHQLIEIYHTIASNMNNHTATSIVFADISRAFDRLSHRGLYAKMDLYGFSKPVKDWLISFLSERKQRVCVNGTYSDWQETHAGVAQGSVIGPIMFLLMINDLPSHLQSNTRLFADDTSLIFSHPPSFDITNDINDEMTRLRQWADTWMIDLNPTKTKFMCISPPDNNRVTPSPSFHGTPIEIVDSHKHLGLIINNSLTWKDHIDYLVTKVSKRIGILRALKFRLTRTCLRTIYMTHIRSVLE